MNEQLARRIEQLAVWLHLSSAPADADDWTPWARVPLRLKERYLALARKLITNPPPALAGWQGGQSEHKATTEAPARAGADTKASGRRRRSNGKAKK